MMCITKREIYEFAKQCGVLKVQSEQVEEFVIKKLFDDDSGDDCDTSIVRNVVIHLKQRWARANRWEKKFLEKNCEWLAGTICLSDPCRRPSPKGRPSLPFAEKSRRSKLRVTEELREQQGSSELLFAATSAMHQEGRRTTAQLVEAVSSPGRGPLLADKLAKAEAQQLRPYTPEEALATLVDLDLSKAQYERLRLGAIEHGADLYPSYHRVLQAKAACMPSADSMLMSPTLAEVQLQALLDQTTERLLTMQKEVVEALKVHDETLHLTCSFKWGMDGSSGHARYKQAGVDRDDQVMVTSLVPLRLAAHDGTVVWDNATPNSPRFCRPISVQFEKETPALVVAETNKINDQIRDLSPLRTESAEVTYDLRMTMVDTKIVNILTDTPAPRCSMCGASSKIVNDLEAVSRLEVTNTEFGISTLHCWIRVFEAILHVAYRLRLDDPTHRVLGADRKAVVEATKRDIQGKFRQSLGLIVDEPRAGGSGNTDDGNTARRAFQAPEKFSECTGVDVGLIRRLHVVLQAVSCCLPLSVAKLSAYCVETAELYIQLYKWYPMPPTLHRLLMHSAEVVQQCLLPIGMLSEEAAEARHKHVRAFRLQHARKDSRTHNISDVFGRLLITSDPLLSSIGQAHRRLRRSRQPLLPEAIALLAAPPLPDSDGDSDSDSG